MGYGKQEGCGDRWKTIMVDFYAGHTLGKVVDVVSKNQYGRQIRQ